MTFKTIAFAALAFALPQAATAACNDNDELIISVSFRTGLISQSVRDQLLAEAECRLDMVEMVQYITTEDHILAANPVTGMFSYKRKGALTMTCVDTNLRAFVVDAKGKDHC